MIIRRIAHFFSETIWIEDIESLSFRKRSLFRAARVTFIVVKGFTDERLNQQAAALTYVSFLSLIPLMAVLFGLARGFGFQENLTTWIREILGELVVEDVLNSIIDYVSQTNVAALGAIGFFVLIWTVLKTLLNLERSFNQIWSVDNSRPFYRALAYYLSVVLIAPLLVAAATTVSAMLQAENSQYSFVVWIQNLPGSSFIMGLLSSLVPYAITWIAFSLIYAFMVNTHVNLLAAVSGGFVTSLLWNVLLKLYIEIQVGISKNILYGTFAFLPVFLVFLYLSWLLLLFGSRVTFALQNEGAFRRDRITNAAGIRYRAAAGLLVLQDVARRFNEGGKAPKAAKIADRLDLPAPLVHGVLQHFERAGILHFVGNEEREGRDASRLVPARALDTIPVIDVFSALEEGDGSVPMPKGALQKPLKEILDKVESARDAALEGLTVQDMLGEVQ